MFEAEALIAAVCTDVDFLSPKHRARIRPIIMAA